MRIKLCGTNPTATSPETGIKKGLQESFRNLQSSMLKKAATYSPTLRCSTIGALGLNFSVRDGKRWNPKAIAT